MFKNKTINIVVRILLAILLLGFSVGLALRLANVGEGKTLAKVNSESNEEVFYKHSLELEIVDNSVTIIEYVSDSISEPMTMTTFPEVLEENPTLLNGTPFICVGSNWSLSGIYGEYDSETESLGILRNGEFYEFPLQGVTAISDTVTTVNEFTYATVFGNASIDSDWVVGTGTLNDDDLKQFDADSDGKIKFDVEINEDDYDYIVIHGSCLTLNDSLTCASEVKEFQCRYISTEHVTGVGNARLFYFTAKVNAEDFNNELAFNFYTDYNKIVPMMIVGYKG